LGSCLEEAKGIPQEKMKLKEEDAEEE